MSGFDIMFSRVREDERKKHEEERKRLEEERKRIKAKEKREQNLFFQGLSDRFGSAVKPALKKKVLAKIKEKSFFEVILLMASSQSIEEFEQKLDNLPNG